jgi:hypothetical protein
MNRHEPYTMKTAENGVVFISHDRELERRKAKFNPRLFGAWADSVALNAEALKLSRLTPAGEC